MSKIQHLPTFLAILTLSRSTDFNVHLPTHVGTDDGISGSIMLVPTGRGYPGCRKFCWRVYLMNLMNRYGSVCINCVSILVL
ncbi:hypothetical protein CBW58_03105 [Yersinia frederiksenii]|nr:hypothetical protein CBW58_03105 [Yersinia frederiksenii]